jgi:hypothetical protein
VLQINLRHKHQQNTPKENEYNDVSDSRSSTIQQTLDGLGSTVGIVTSGEGRWTFDTNESIFNLLKETLNGREITGETCNTIIYTMIFMWKQQHHLLL